MNKHVLPVIKTASILTLIAAVGALAIATVNYFTAPIIDANAKRKEQESLASLFGKDATFKEAKAVQNCKFIKKYYPVTLSDGSEARAYQGQGNNQYGSISLLAGIIASKEGLSYSLYSLVLLEDGQSFGSVLEETYVDNIAHTDNKDDALEEVKCGATFGAKLIRDIVKEAQAHYKESNNG